MAMPDIPMYVFTGFLESGKTKFIQETLEDERFNTGERTLLLVFEEGEEEYDISITFTTSGMLYSTPFRYMLAELRDGDSGWHWGSCHDPRLKEYYYAMTEAINDEQYIENSRNLQHLADEEMFGLTFAWQTGFFPYRTDMIEGWDNWQSWGVINARTWFDLTAK